MGTQTGRLELGSTLRGTASRVSSRIAVLLRLRNTNTHPENGSSARFSWHSRASESIPTLLERIRGRFRSWKCAILGGSELDREEEAEELLSIFERIGPQHMSRP